ncbi:carbon-nitrogen hydrolase [Rhizodiscina lignyota]|uniref:Carbon-nitrogen hydrolase n=1 Tax=Rhizodiscina lignyota TaxID=1504668 RepID=A0A9P4I431_9PEZI|nr:carbon-nitrogen hydrolase [Rhizodiscina lignyota]
MEFGSGLREGGKVACLQFNPSLGEVKENMRRAEELLEGSGEFRGGGIDWLILPEMAFSGYNFPSLQHIQPFLEPTASGPSTKWAIRTANRYNCHVTVGYPETVKFKLLAARHSTLLHNSFARSHLPVPKRYNSTVTVNPQGEVIYHYRKCFLYYTDESWADEGPGIPISLPSVTTPENPFRSVDLGTPLGQIHHGICMDINPYKFIDYTKYEFATAALSAKAPTIVLSMAWLTNLSPDELALDPNKPDMNTFAYWMDRFWPVNRGMEEVTMIFANRCGVEDNARYAGSSTVVRVRQGDIRVFGQLGKAEEGVLVVDTKQVGYSASLVAPRSYSSLRY